MYSVWQKVQAISGMYRTPSAERPRTSRSRFLGVQVQPLYTDMLCHLYWLPVQYHIKFKLALYI